MADRLADAALLTAYHQVEYVTSTGPFIKKAIAAGVEENVIELKVSPPFVPPSLPPSFTINSSV